MLRHHKKKSHLVGHVYTIIFYYLVVHVKCMYDRSIMYRLRQERSEQRKVLLLLTCV